MSSALPPISAPFAASPSIRLARLPFHTRAAILLLTFWTVSQVIAAIPSVPDELRGIFVKGKVIVGPLVLLFIALSSRMAVRVRSAFVMMLIFSAYSAFNMMMCAEPNWPRALLVTAWAGCFVLIPALLNSQRRVERFLHMVTPALFVSVLLAVGMGLASDTYADVGGLRGRFHFGMNPNYFAALSATMSYSGFISLVLTPRHRRPLAWTALWGGILLTYLTDCRTQLLMLAVGFSVYGAYAGGLVARLSKLFLFSGTLFASAFLAFVSSPVVSLEQFNAFTSGRVLVWYSLLKNNFGSGELMPLLFGHSNPTLDMGLALWRRQKQYTFDAFDRAVETQAVFKRIALTDNAYMDALLWTGLIGLVLALWAWFRWWKHLAPQRGETLQTRRSKGIARGLIAGILVTGMFSSSWPAMGSVMVSFGVVLAIALTTITTGGQRTRRPAQPLRNPAPVWNPPGRIR